MIYDLSGCSDKELENKLNQVSTRLNMAYNLGNETVIDSLDRFKQQILGEIAARSSAKKNKNVQSADIISFGHIDHIVTGKQIGRAHV